MARSPTLRRRARLAALVGAPLLVLAGTTWGAAPAPANQSITLDRTESSPGEKVAWTANGFDNCLPADDVQTDGTLVLYWDEEQQIDRETLAAGTASGTFDVPESAKLTGHHVTAQCLSNDALNDTADLIVTPPRTPDVAVPNLVGKFLPEAKLEIEASRLELGVVSGSGDVVAKQFPDPGSPVQPQTNVDLQLGTAPTDIVVVPDVRGLPVTEAQAKLESEGVTLGDVANPGGGKVQEQLPLPGEEAAPGFPVDVVLGQSPTTRVHVPDLRGRRLADIPALLDRRDLELGLVTGNGVTVRSQRPAPGALVPVRSEVNVSVQRGRLPVRVVAVPDLVGLTADEALERLSDAGLVLSEPHGDGTISSQQPVARTKVAVGSTVHVAFEVGPPWARIAGIAAAMLLVAGAGVTGRRLVRRRGDQRWVAENLTFQPVAHHLEDHVAERDVGSAPPTWVLRLQPHRDPGTQTVQEVDP